MFECAYKINTNVCMHMYILMNNTYAATTWDPRYFCNSFRNFLTCLHFKDSALQWVLRADVERTSLLDDEARLLHYLHQCDNSDGSGTSNGTTTTTTTTTTTGGGGGGGGHAPIVKDREEKAGNTRYWVCTCTCLYV